MSDCKGGSVDRSSWRQDTLGRVAVGKLQLVHVLELQDRALGLLVGSGIEAAATLLDVGCCVVGMGRGEFGFWAHKGGVFARSFLLVLA